MVTEAERATLFIVSGARGAAAAADWPGWRVVPDDGGDGVAARALASAAALLVVDGRDDPDGGLVGVRALGGLAAATGGALLAWVDDLGPLEALHAAGATHFLIDRNDADERLQVARFAARAPIDRRNHGIGEPAEAPDAAVWLSARRAAGDAVGVLRIALSRLDILNAARGRAVGDASIAAARARVTAITRALLGPAGFVAAPAGGEIVVAAAASPEVMTTLAAALDAALAQPLPIGQRQAVLGSRWGMAVSGPDDDAVRLLRRAGEALRDAKASDGAMIRIAGPEGAAPLDSLAIDLHLAIERGEIDVLFQPQARFDSPRITGVEALARWTHGRLGPLGADALFAAADRADLGIALSDHIQRLVLARVAAWPAALDHLRVSLNLTAGDLGRPGFAALFLARVQASGVPFDRLTVEITETGAIRNLEAAAAVLATLRDAGVRVALDDFGTGYSSLAYLTALPLDYLKLDKALACAIDGNARHRGVVRAVMTLARSLDLPVIAEGVESDVQHGLLAAEGCTYLQGYWLAEPLDEAALVARVEEGE
ncbi:EAL domain-containing protein [Sphingomonas sp. RIT328]|uniref:EAL domain-containing protein n=1 Tax=Sphingomonas sp. RIT328 TaxID=1470591 RepID=UPI0004486E3A|nr:EAL domain-containing protein [Sphingomonas sp. RIT328]EZP52809.1 EAL domain protein [Sphingomonas sp. RIT328]